MIIEARGDVVQLEGALDKNYWPAIQAAANLLLRQHHEGIIIDGGALTDCTPAGADTFRDAMDAIERYRARIVVAALPDCVMETVKAVPGVRSRLPLAATLEEARASLSLTRACQVPTRRRALQNVLVPILQPDAAESLVTLAVRLAKPDGHGAHLHLAYVLEIPRHLPLNAPLAEEEAAAKAALDAAAAAVRHDGLTPVIHLRRARDVAEEIVAQAGELGVALIALSYAAPDDPSDESLRHILRAVLDRAPCEVVLNKIVA